jgi:hypothetical protein
MGLIKFKEYVEEILSIPVLLELKNDEAIVEWSESDWNSLSVVEQAELESEAVEGWSNWQAGPLEDFDTEMFEGDKIYEYIQALEESSCDVCGEDPCICDKDEAAVNAEEWLKEYKAKNTMQRRATQRNKDRNKFQNRQGKLKDKIERKKGGNKVKRLKMRKKWMKVNRSKIKNAQKVYGGKVKSKFTKKR